MMTDPVRLLSDSEYFVSCVVFVPLNQMECLLLPHFLVFESVPDLLSPTWCVAKVIYPFISKISSCLNIKIKNRKLKIP